MRFLLPIFVFSLLLFPDSTKADAPVKILIVPGHEFEVWGAQYGNIKEADMNLSLAEELHRKLAKDERFELYITRDWQGYTKNFSDYFRNNAKEIEEFRTKAKEKYQAKIDKGEILKKEGVPHNSARSDTAFKLYAINKWAIENNIDAIIHIHFNDYPRSTKWTKGKYRGFAVYKPEAQMANAEQTAPLAETIFKKLREKYAISTYPPESKGLIEEQKLIAPGSNDTLGSIPSVLVEYGYIYRFGNQAFRLKAYQDMASRTAE